MFKRRIKLFQEKLTDKNLDAALITDEDNIYYFTGYYDYLHMNFGRPTILLVSTNSDNHLITPEMELHMAQSSAYVDKIHFWNDGLGKEWREKLPDLISKSINVGYETNLMPPIVQNYITTIIQKNNLFDITPVVEDLRMIKSSEELQMARHAGQVANAMMTAGRKTIAEGVHEYEVALATSAAGAHKASELLNYHYSDKRMSPNTHFLQIMASGDEISMPHHRASNRIMNKGEPVFLCFCGMTNFHRFKLGFDRMFWIGEITNKIHKKVYNIAIKSQAAALEKLKPGVMAQDIHSAYAEVIKDAGYSYPFRCGRATGFSYLEKPQIVFGDKTLIQPGMVFAIDGSVTLDSTFRAQVGDSFIVTEDGYEQITNHPKTLEDVII